MIGWSWGCTSGVSSLISFFSSLDEDADAVVVDTVDELEAVADDVSLLVLIFLFRGCTAVSDVVLELVLFD